MAAERGPSPGSAQPAIFPCSTRRPFRIVGLDTRRRQFSTAGVRCSIGDKGRISLLDSSPSGADVSSYAEQLATEAGYPFIFRIMQAALETAHNGSLLAAASPDGSAGAMAAAASAVPWWGVIVGSALVLRAVLILPVYIYQQRAAARSTKLAHLQRLWYQPMRESLKLELAANKSKVSDEQFQKMLVKRVSARHHRLMFEQGCHPVFNIMLPLTQIPIWVTMTSCLRHFSGRLVPLIDEPSGALPIPAPGMSSEGLLWFCDLAAVDSTGMLPAITGLVYLGNALAQRYRHNDYVLARLPEGSAVKDGWFARLVPCLGFVAPIVITSVAMGQPSAIVLYWIASASFTLVQTLVFHNQRLRKKLGFISLRDKPAATA
ncbi:hypothetical protein EV174_004186 [Coemansia sp. RSA 2320]|nr:hypothetical protein EV174_004186 [Coemansia sp. RSA 2320]